MFQKCELICEGLKFALEDATKPTHKKKHILKSPFLNILNTYTYGWGTQAYREELIKCFLVAVQHEKARRMLPVVDKKSVKEETISEMTEEETASEMTKEETPKSKKKKKKRIKKVKVVRRKRKRK